MRTYLTSSRPRSAATRRALSCCRSISRASAAGCSFSSSSSHDIRLASREHLRNLEPVVEYDDVGPGAGLEHTEIRPADDPRRHVRRSTDRGFERDTESVQVANRLE